MNAQEPETPRAPGYARGLSDRRISYELAMSPTNFSPPWLSDLSCQSWYCNDWSLEWYSKLKSQPAKPALQVNAELKGASPKTAARIPCVVEQSALAAAQPAGLYEELVTVPERKPWNPPVTPAPTVEP